MQNDTKLMSSERRCLFRAGMKDGIPIGLGYFAVSFSLGIAASRAGLNAFQGFFASLLIAASAGEYALFSTIAENGTYLEMLIITLVANARYLLMSCALSQRMDERLPLRHRIGVGFYLTDELFGIAVAREGNVQPLYSYGAFLIAVPSWSAGTAFGVIMGNILPLRVVSALGVALYGMFLAIIVPPAKKDRVVAALIAASFLLSFACSRLALTASLSGGTRTIILTVALSALAAILFPMKEDTADA